MLWLDLRFEKNKFRHKTYGSSARSDVERSLSCLGVGRVNFNTALNQNRRQLWSIKVSAVVQSTVSRRSWDVCVCVCERERMWVIGRVF